MDSNQYNNILKNLYDSLCFYGYVIDDVGEVLGLSMDSKDKDFDKAVHHDYVYFCITKSVRSLVAAVELSKLRFREDAMIILRTVYECYLLLANAIRDLKFIEKSVYNELGLKYGIYSYPQNSRGTIDFLKVVRDDTGKTFDNDLGIRILSKNTYNSIDYKVHRQLYKYLSEYTHSHFIGAGNYRTEDNSRYDSDNHGIYIDVLFTITYLTYLVGESIYLYHEKYDYSISLTVNEIIEFAGHFKRLTDDFNLIFEELNLNDYGEKFKKGLRDRINNNFS